MSRLSYSVPAEIKIALVDDQPLFRAGINSLLKDYDGLKVIMEAGNGKDLFKMLETHSPDVVLLDIEMPEMNGIETAKLLRKKNPEIKIIILTMHNEEEFIFDLMTKGVHGFLPKDKSVEEVVDAIYTVMEKGIYYNNEVNVAIQHGNQGLIKAAPPSTLTLREKEVIKMICQELTIKEIADKLDCTIKVIEKIRTGIFAKTGAKNMVGVVVYALRNKLVSVKEI